MGLGFNAGWKKDLPSDLVLLFLDFDLGEWGSALGVPVGVPLLLVLSVRASTTLGFFNASFGSHTSSDLSRTIKSSLLLFLLIASA